MSSDRTIRVAGKAAIGKGSVRVVVRHQRAALKTTPTPWGLLLELADGETDKRPGEPAIPFVRLRVALPPYAVVSALKATIRRRTAVTAKPALIAPVQPQRFDDDPADQKRPARRRPPPIALPDAKAYERLAASPPPLAVVTDLEHHGVATVATLALRPVRPRRGGLLEFATDVELVLRYAPAAAVQDAGAACEARFVRPPRTSTEAQRVCALLRGRVVNPDWLVQPGDFPPWTPDGYLIITDDRMREAFARLAAWKRRRGLRTYVVTLADILDGAYGDFAADARDTPEVIRNFLKWAHAAWTLHWALLGGDTNVIPIRRAAGSHSAMFIGPPETIFPPPDNKSYWDGVRLYVRVGDQGVGWPGVTPPVLVSCPTGTVIPYDAAGAAGPTNPGWWWAADESYSARSSRLTPFVCVEGPADVVAAELQWFFDRTLIPTDLYYASLTTPAGGPTGAHDWDATGSGLYGLHYRGTDLDGVVFAADLGVGRAPVGNAAEASAFVDKVIAYERQRAPNGARLGGDRLRQLTLVAANWGGPIAWLGPTASVPPGDNTYHHDPTQPYSLLKLEQTPTDIRWRMLAELPRGDYSEIPYDRDAAASGRGWRFVCSATDLTTSERLLWFMGALFWCPLPTEWLTVHGAPEELAPTAYVLDSLKPDGSMTDQELLRKQVQALSLGFDDFDRLYQDVRDLPPDDAAAAPVAQLTTPRIRAALDRGPHFLSLSGHGNENGCCRLDRQIARDANNGRRTAIVYADSCLINNVESEDSMGEELVKNPHGGALACIGNTRISLVGHGAVYQRGFFRAFRCVRHLASAADSRLSLRGHGLDSYWWVMFSLNLLGDPETPVWVGDAEPLRAAHPRSLRRQAQVVRVAVRDAAGAPVPRAVVSLAMGDSWIVTGRTDAGGRAAFRITPPTVGAMEIIASREDYAPYLGTIRVRPAPAEREPSSLRSSRMV